MVTEQHDNTFTTLVIFELAKKGRDKNRKWVSKKLAENRPGKPPFMKRMELGQSCTKKCEQTSFRRENGVIKLVGSRDKKKVGTEKHI